MRSRVLIPLVVLCVLGMLTGISCYDDDCHRHYHGNTGIWHCHDDDFHSGHSHQTSEVVVLITDHPIEDVDAFLVTISEVQLIDEDAGPMWVYRSDTGRRVDLLSLRGSRSSRLYDLLASQEVPAGVYDSIRLTVRDPVMVLDSGEVLEGARIDLAGHGTSRSVSRSSFCSARTRPFTSFSISI